MESTTESALLIDFDSLPYPLFESDWELLKQYKEAAIKKEEEILRRKKKRNEDLLSYVANRLQQWESKRKLIAERNGFRLTTNSISSPFIAESCPPPAVSNHHHQFTTPPVRSVSYIPVRSPPKRTSPVPTANNRSKDSVLVMQLRAHQPLPHQPVAHQSVAHRPIAAHPMHLSSFTCSTKSKKSPMCIIGAVAKGFMTRRLLNSEKIKDIVTTIKDAEQVLQSLDSPGTMQEIDLQQRVINQLQTAKLKLYHIFFELPPSDKMAYIAHSRNLRQERQLKKLQLQEMKRRQLSTATLKSMERKKKHSLVSTTVTKKDKGLAKKLTPTVKPDSSRRTSGAIGLKRENTTITTTTSTSSDKRTRSEAKQSLSSERKKYTVPNPSSKSTVATSVLPDGSVQKGRADKGPQYLKRGSVTTRIPPPLSTGKYQRRPVQTSKTRQQK